MKAAARGHEEYQLLVPWFVNGTLDASEMDRFSAHMAACTSCRQQVESELAFARQYVELLPLRQPDTSRMEAGLEDLMARIEAPAATVRWQKCWPLAMAASLLAISLMSLIWLVPDSQVYRTLTRSSEVASGTVLQVVFEPQTPEREVRRLLIDTGATIISGPSAQGVYRIELPADANEKVVIAYLKAQPATLMLEREIR